MGLFNNFSTPGKGITQEEAEKRGYFAIIGRKWTKLITLNLLYLGCNIILFAAIILLLLPLLVSDKATTEDLFQYIKPILNGKRLPPVLPFVPFLFFGPTNAGLTYVTRNFARQEHAFVASDFFEHSRKNFRQGLTASIILTVVAYFFLTAMLFYARINRYFLFPFVLTFGTVLLIASFYVYPLMVTFDDKLTTILKNALLLSVINFPKNILTLLALGVVHIALLWFVPFIWFALMSFFLMAWSSYTINFTAWGAIEKILKKKNESENAES